MERLQKLLFELSSSERMSIVIELQRHWLKLSQVSRNLDLTTAETSRHLQRLSEASLVQKDVKGRYGLTTFGTLVLSQLSGLDFVGKHQAYFMEYDTSGLPYEFLNRIGELGDAVLISETFRSLEEAEKRFREAEEFIWILSDQILKSSIPILAEKVKRPFDTRINLPGAVMPPDSEAVLPSTMPGVQKRILPKVDVAVVMTEKYATFSFPNHSGRMDYRAFSGEEPKFHKWCKDLFLYYWDKAERFIP